MRRFDKGLFFEVIARFHRDFRSLTLRVGHRKPPKCLPLQEATELRNFETCASGSSR